MRSVRLTRSSFLLRSIPRVLWVMRDANTFKPSVDRLEVVINWVVIYRFNLVRIMEIYLSSVPSSSERLKSIFTSCEDFNVDHIILLGFVFRIIVNAAVKYKISWLHVIQCLAYWECVKKISLVPSSNFESEINSKVSQNLFDQSATVQVKWSIVVLFTLFPVACCVWYSYVALCFFNKLFPEFVLISSRPFVVLGKGWKFSWQYLWLWVFLERVRFQSLRHLVLKSSTLSILK